MWILVSFPLIVAIAYDKKFNWNQIFILIIPTLITFFLSIKFGNIDEDLSSFHQKFISLYPNIKIDYLKLENWEINPWKSSPTKHSILEFFEYSSKSLNGIYLIFFTFFHFMLLLSLLKNISFFYKILFLSAISSSLIMFFLGVDYGRWVVCFSLNIFFFGLYLLHQNVKVQINPFLASIICFFALLEVLIIVF